MPGFRSQAPVGVIKRTLGLDDPGSFHCSLGGGRHGHAPRAASAMSAKQSTLMTNRNKMAKKVISSFLFGA